MRTPVEALLLILSYEQLRLVPYRDAVGVWTWGWGHAQRPDEERPGQLTREQANRLFIADLEEAETGVVRALGDTELAPHQVGALVSFAFNAGVAALRGSTLLRKAREGDLERAAVEFRRWVYGTVDGRKVKLGGLIDRRAAEERLWRGVA